MKIIRISTIPFSLNNLLKNQLKILSQSYEVIGISSSGKDLIEVAEREGVKTISVEMERRISLAKDLFSLYKLYVIFKKEKPAIVHSITPKAGFLSMIAGWLAEVPVRIHTFTGLIFPSRTGFMYHLLKNIDRLTCVFATKIIPEGEGVKRELIEHRVTRKPLKVIGNGNVNGINVDYFSPVAICQLDRDELRKQLKIDTNDYVFVFVGRLVKDKGIKELVQAFKNIGQKHLQTKLILVGNTEPELDPLLPQTEQEIKKNPNIITTGFQSDVRPYLAVSNALVFPSYREGFPNAPMQAGAMGLPSIVTNISGCNEIVQHEQNGLIVPPKDAPALEQSMLRLLEEKALFQKLAANARESIVSRFDQQTLWKLLKEEYDEQLKKAGLI